MKPASPKILRSIWALYDTNKEFCGTYTSKDDADDDAVGPRFRPKYTIRQYELVPRKGETDERSTVERY